MHTVRELPEEIIKADGVVLRPPRPADADDIVAACGDPAIQRYLPGIPIPYTKSDALQWITEGRASTRAAGGLNLLMADPRTDRVLGSISVHHVWHLDGLAEIGYWVAPWARGRGVATTATTALCDWVHGHRLHRVELLIELENWPSQRVALAAGFRREGVRRSARLRRDGQRGDMAVFARLPGDPPGPSPRILPDLPGGKLDDGTVQLRPLWSGDAEDVYPMRTLPEEVIASVPPVTPTRADVLRICAEAPGRWLAGERAALTIRDAVSGVCAGEIGLYYSDPVSAQGRIGYGVSPAWRGRGYATRAVRLLAGWAFGSVGIARLVAGTAPENVASQRVLERAGFVREGYLHSRLAGPDGTRIDDILYALLP